MDFVTQYFGHQREDVVEWLKSVKWEEDLAEVKEDVVRETLRCALGSIRILP